MTEKILFCLNCLVGLGIEQRVSLSVYVVHPISPSAVALPPQKLADRENIMSLQGTVNEGTEEKNL